MVSRESLNDYLTAYSSSELIARRHFEICPDRSQGEDFFKNLYSEDRTLTEKQVFPENCGNIITVKHSRYATSHYHAHEFLEIIYMYKGTCKNTVEGMPYTMETGDIYIIPPGVYHYLSVTDESIAVNILVRKPAVGDIFRAVLRKGGDFSDFIDSMLHSYKYPKCVWFKSCGDAGLSELICDLLLELINREEYYEAVSENRLSDIFCRLLRYGRKMECSPSTASDALPSKKLLAYMYDNYGDATLENAARSFGYSKTYICRTLKKHTGQTFSEIMTQIRLDKACSLLATTDMKINDIASDIGYRHCEQFHRMFKAQFGTTPVKFRKCRNPESRGTPAF